MGGGGNSSGPTSLLRLQALNQSAPVSKLKSKNFKAFQPGHKNQLAKQMSEAYGGSVKKHKGLFDGIYSNQSIPMIFNAADMAALERKFSAQGSVNASDAEKALAESRTIPLPF